MADIAENRTQKYTSNTERHSRPQYTPKGYCRQWKTQQKTAENKNILQTMENIR